MDLQTIDEQHPTGGRYFDQVARAYDAVRISYPDELFNDIFDYASSAPLQRALEIGCGTGQATRSMAPRGLSIVCIEPGPNLAELAERNLSAFDNVRVTPARFEDWIPEEDPFDLVFSANAIHWVHPRVRTRKTARVLRPGGTLALFRSIPLRNTSLERRIDALMGSGKPAEEPSQLPKEADFRRSSYFDDFCKHRYETIHTFDADSYAALLFTMQRYHRIPAKIRGERVAEARAIVQEHGGTISVTYATHLLLARQKSRHLWRSALVHFKRHWPFREA